jgi:hypothetical protein
MCESPLTGPGYLVDGATKYGRKWWRAQLLICEACYTRGGPDPETGLTRAASLREAPRRRWSYLVGRGEQMSPAPCAACGQMVVRASDPLLKRVTCSRACSTSLTRSRNGGKGSGQPCETCGKQITTGRADSRYCGSACRQKAYRQRARDGHA